MDFLKKSALFLDRDGVLNVHRPGDYVKKTEEFVFEQGSLEAMAILNQVFERIFVVTNQRGVGRGLMTETSLQNIHEAMLTEITSHNGRVDRIYYCTDTDPESPNRKPNIGMGLQAKKEFPEIDFKLSYMVGDSKSDIEFGRRLGMKTVLIGKNSEYHSLLDFAKHISEIQYHYP